jgi:hypothetical protein
MDGDDEDRSPAQQAVLDQWFTRSPDEIEQERQAAEQAGREAYAEAIRTGQDVQARTPADLVALGRARLAQQTPQGDQDSSAEPQDCSKLGDAAMQGDAFVRGVANNGSFGAADPIAAGMETLLGHGVGRDLGQRYQYNLQQQDARDAYDAQHRTLAHVLGNVAGTGLSYLEGSALGAGWASGLSPAMKGKVGEGLSIVKTRIRADSPVGLQVDKKVVGGFTRADHTTSMGQIVESKFGPTARLSRRQLQAQQDYHPNYRVDWWGPDDIGAIAGGAAAGFSLGSDDPNSQ